MTTLAITLIDSIVSLVDGDDNLIDQYVELIETAIVIANRLNKILVCLHERETGETISTSEEYCMETETEYDEVMRILCLMKNDIWELPYAIYQSVRLLKALDDLREYAVSANSKI